MTASSPWTVGLVGTRSERFRRGLQAFLGIAWEFDPWFGRSASRVDILPQQLDAVHDFLLKLARVRFLLADDAGAGEEE